MRHRKSIMAAAMLAAFGLVTAAHVGVSGNMEAMPQHLQASVVNATSAVKAMVWVDPPAHVAAVSVLSDAVVSTAQAAEVAKPEIVDHGPRATPALQPRAMVRKAAQSRAKAHRDQSAGRLDGTEVMRRHRLAQRRTRLFRASLTHRVPAASGVGEQAPAPAPAPKAADQSDPIRILIHGLGLDG
ncbi:hypothetical protein [Methylobacterium sp. CM6257]